MPSAGVSAKRPDDEREEEEPLCLDSTHHQHPLKNVVDVVVAGVVVADVGRDWILNFRNYYYCCYDYVEGRMNLRKN